MAKKNVSPLIIALIILGILACSAFIYFQIMRGLSDDEPPPPVAPPVAELPLPAPEPEPELEVPPLDGSDEMVRSLIRTLSAHPRLAAYLAPEALVRRFVAAVVNIANGESPRPQLGFLEPKGDFRVSEREGTLYVDSASYARYDLVTDIFDSLDDEQSLELYRQLKPLFDEAYQELGYPGGDFDDPLARAIDRVLLAPVPAGRVTVKRRVNTYRYADPALEALGPVAKHLHRMGPANARTVQSKLRLLRASL